MNSTLLSYFEHTAESIRANAFAGITTLDDWKRARATLHRQYMHSLGFEGMPEPVDLRVTEHQSHRGEGYRARNVSFRILEDCYGSGMIFYPDPAPLEKLPAVLYLCGHANFGIVDYHPHAIMWARKGYVCLILDTIRQTDNTGEHSGLSRNNRRDWISMGYSAAGGEFLNSLRGLDVLCSLPEVDTNRIGCTGLSGGGAHSFFLGLADTRVKAVGSACGAVNLAYTVRNRNYNSNCDCMFLYNPYRRDTAEFAALMAPRPLLFCHARGDYLFTPEENEKLVESVKRIYRLYGCEQNVRLFQFDGPHSYQPESVAAINDWFDRHLEMDPPIAQELGEPTLGERECTIFNGDYPVPNRLDILPEILTPPRSFPIPDTMEEFQALKSRVVAELRERVFGYLEKSREHIEAERIHEWKLGRTEDCARTEKYRASMGGMELWITRHIPQGGARKVLVYLCGLDEDDVRAMGTLQMPRHDVEIIIVQPRAGGQNSYNQTLTTRLHIVGLYVGLSPVVMWVKDLAEVCGFFRQRGDFDGKEVYLYGVREAGAAVLYHTIFDPGIDGVIIGDIFSTHRKGGYIPGILKVLDVEQALGLLAPRMIGLDTYEWEFVFWSVRLYQRLGIRDRFVHTHSMVHTLQGIFGRSSEQ